MEISIENVRFKVWGEEFVKLLKTKDSNWDGVQEFYGKLCGRDLTKEGIDQIIAGENFKRAEQISNELLPSSLSIATLISISNLSEEALSVYIQGFAYMKLTETRGKSSMFTVCDIKRYCEDGMLTNEDVQKLKELRLNISQNCL